MLCIWDTGNTSLGSSWEEVAPGWALTTVWPHSSRIIQQLVNGIITPATIPNLGLGPW